MKNKSVMTVLMVGLLAMAWGCEEQVRPQNSDPMNPTNMDRDSDGISDYQQKQERDTGIREEVCNDAGNCYCLRMAVIGRTDSASGQTDVSAFADWLNNDSSCAVTEFTDKPALTQTFLDEYDVILFQYLSSDMGGNYWQFSDDEVAALKAWVEAGGGMVTLTGYNGNDKVEEVAAINRILKPVSGMYYNADTYLDANGGPCGGTLMSDQTEADACWCWGNTVPVYGWDRGHEISREIQQIPIMYGYSINAPAGAVPVATQDGGAAATTQNAGVALEIGKGRVFAWADEWVIFNDQWRDGDTTPGNSPDEYNVCYDMDKQLFNNAENYFQIPQFWYNVIGWVAPPNDCFIIKDPGVVV